MHASPKPDASPAGRWLAQWGVFLLAAGLGALLLTTSVHSYLRSEGLEAAIIRGEAQALGEAFGRRMQNQGRPSAAKLAEFLAQHEDTGLVHVAILDRKGQVEFEAGDAGSLRPGPGIKPGILQENGKVRAIQQMRHHGPPPKQLRTQPGHSAGPGHPPPPRVSFVFAPTLAQELAHRAQRDLWLGLIYSASLLLGASIFARLRGRLDHARDELEQNRRLGLVGQMSATLAHELQNPIAGLKGHAQLLGEQLEGQGRVHQKALKVVAQARRLEDLVDNLLAFLRSGKIASVETEVEALCRQALAAHPPQRWHLDLSAAPKQWVLDPIQIGQVLENLVRNALQANDLAADGTGEHAQAVELKVQCCEAQLELLVLDRGTGLPEGEAERIFEPFFTTKTTGVGLGLSVARRVVELHGGELSLGPREGGGTMARIRLPDPGALKA